LNQKKIFNDPVYGFITIPSGIIYEIVNHPWFQRLTRIRQLGLTYLVYPGAIHTRFQHTLGALHLMNEAIEVLRSKGHEITDSEKESAGLAILMHDIGHGPFSHALEHMITGGLTHEKLSEIIMRKLNDQFNGALTEAISIFRDQHPKKFLHSLVSSQLDVDRLDYLNRDSFFTGVSEGVISSDRIIKMLEINNNDLVVEEKGIYSVEKFIIARRLMYWQVYLHKTVLSAEMLLVNIIQRARELALSGDKGLFCTPCLSELLYNDHRLEEFENNDKLLECFVRLDDADVLASVKVWCSHPDPTLSFLCKSLINRKLYKVRIKNDPFDVELLKNCQEQAATQYMVNSQLAHYYCFTSSIQNNAYSSSSEKINILFKSGEVKDIASASDNLNISVLSNPVKKHYLCAFEDVLPS
jgi:HD superfamily phosphohydrolase